MVPKDAQSMKHYYNVDNGIERRKRRNPIEKLFLLFIAFAFFFVVVGICSVVFFILFADANYKAPSSSYKDDNSIVRNTKTIRSVLSTYPTSGIPFDGSRYINLDYVPSMSSETITFWVRLRDLSTPGRRTVVSTHDNLCSRQESSSVNGYSLFFEVLENSQVRFHVIYQSRRRDCDDFVVSVSESLNRWTHVAVVFNILECSDSSNLCKMELSVFIGGVIQDKRIVSYRHYGGDLSERSSQMHLGSDAYGVSAFIGDLSAIAFFDRALDESSIIRLSSSKTVSHEILPSLVRVIHPQNGAVVSVNESEEEELHLKPVAREEIESMEKEEKENFATRRSNRRRHGTIAVTSSKDLEKKQDGSDEKKEPYWKDIRIEDLDTDDDDDDEEEEEVTEPPKTPAPVIPDPIPESVVDLSGTRVVYIDETKTVKRRIRHNKSDIELFVSSLKSKDTTHLKSGSYHFRVPHGVEKEWEALCAKRIVDVKEAMSHFWKNYKQYAWGHDELLPLTKAGLDNNGHVGMTLVESLDTLWLLDMKEEFDEAVDWIATYMEIDSRDEVSVYEYNVRLLGGLLSAYELSKKEVLLEKATEVGNLILKAFDNRSAFPAPYIIPRTGESSQSTKKVFLSEVGSLGLELTHLTRLTHNTKYSSVVRSINDAFAKMETMDGLYPDSFSRFPGIQLKKEYSMGESTISFYECLLKGYIQSGFTHFGLKRRFDAALEGIDKWLLRTSYHGGYAYIGMNDGSRFEPSMEQSTCSFAALYALNSNISPNAKTATSHERKARALAYTCYQMFKSTTTGLAADRIYFDENKDFFTKTVGTEYKLRGEVIEALYVLHETTEDPIYVEWGWEILESILKYCKTENGFASYRDVNSKDGDLMDEVQSFFSAKTIKYLYLLLSPTRVVELQKVLFTNGGHMLPIFSE